MMRAVFSVVALVGCTATAPMPAQSLAGTSWQLEAIDGQAVVYSPENRLAPYITFGQRSYGANAGCNGLGGLYVYRGGRLILGPGRRPRWPAEGRETRKKH